MAPQFSSKKEDRLNDNEFYSNTQKRRKRVREVAAMGTAAFENNSSFKKSIYPFTPSNDRVLLCEQKCSWAASTLARDI